MYGKFIYGKKYFIVRPSAEVSPAILRGRVSIFTGQDRSDPFTVALGARQRATLINFQQQLKFITFIRQENKDKSAAPISALFSPTIPPLQHRDRTPTYHVFPDKVIPPPHRAITCHYAPLEKPFPRVYFNVSDETSTSFNCALDYLKRERG